MDIKLSTTSPNSRQDSQPRARFIGGGRSVNLIPSCFLRSSASSRWVFIRALISSSRFSFLAWRSCRHVRSSLKCYKSLVRRRELSMTSEGPRTQKSTYQSRLGAPGNNEPAKGLIMFQCHNSVHIRNGLYHLYKLANAG
jgi:hypothetical protein